MAMSGLAVRSISLSIPIVLRLSSAIYPPRRTTPCPKRRRMQYVGHPWPQRQCFQRQNSMGNDFRRKLNDIGIPDIISQPLLCQPVLLARNRVLPQTAIQRRYDFRQTDYAQSQLIDRHANFIGYGAAGFLDVTLCKCRGIKEGLHVCVLPIWPLIAGRLWRTASSRDVSRKAFWLRSPPRG